MIGEMMRRITKLSSEPTRERNSLDGEHWRTDGDMLARPRSPSRGRSQLPSLPWIPEPRFVGSDSAAVASDLANLATMNRAGQRAILLDACSDAVSGQ